MTTASWVLLGGFLAMTAINWWAFLENRRLLLLLDNAHRGWKIAGHLADTWRDLYLQERAKAE